MYSSYVLLAFYKWYNGDRNLVKRDPTNSCGLCGNLMQFVESLNDDIELSGGLFCDYDVLRYEMGEQFVNAGLSIAFPFHGNSERYFEEVEDKTCHLNDKRVKWVQDRIAEMEE